MSTDTLDAAGLSFDQKTEINKRFQERYDALMLAGVHGHYESMFSAMHQAYAPYLASLREETVKVLEPLAAAAETAQKVRDLHGENEFVLSFGPVAVGVMPLSVFTDARALLTKLKGAAK